MQNGQVRVDNSPTVLVAALQRPSQPNNDLIGPDTMTSQTASQSREMNLKLIPLWASAFVLAALVVMQSTRLHPGQIARAEMTAIGDDFSMLTTQSGNGEILTVLNNRDGNLFVYEVTSAKGMMLVDRLDVDEHFNKGQKP